MLINDVGQLRRGHVMSLSSVQSGRANKLFTEDQEVTKAWPANLTTHTHTIECLEGWINPFTEPFDQGCEPTSFLERKLE